MQYTPNLQYPYYSQMLITFIKFDNLLTSCIVFISEKNNGKPQFIVFLLEKKMLSKTFRDTDASKYVMLS